MKICTKCKVDYLAPLEDYFNKKHDTKDGFQYRCKKCIAEFHKDHYQKRKQYYKKKARKHNSEYRKRNVQLMMDYLKEHPCVDCGEKDPIILEFDHRGDKVINVSEMGNYSVKALQKEIAKCDVRCANCHRRKTAEQLGWYKDIVI